MGAMPSSRSPRRRPDDARRTELLAAARTVIAREGVAAATTRRITQEAGLPHGMFHYWFAGKEELFEELIAEVVEELQQSVTFSTETAGQAGSGVEERLLAAFEVVRRDEQQRPGRQLALYELTALALRTPALRDLARRQYAAYREATTKAAAPWLADQELDLPGGSEALGELLAVVFDGMILAWLADPEGSNPQQVFALLDSLLTRAVAAPEAEIQLDRTT
jgi:AcrR family transcriptional regulator